MWNGDQNIQFNIDVFQKELAKAITLEQGKTLADAEGDVFRGLRKFTSLTCAHTKGDPLKKVNITCYVACYFSAAVMVNEFNLHVQTRIKYSSKL